MDQNQDHADPALGWAHKPDKKLKNNNFSCSAILSKYSELNRPNQIKPFKNIKGHAPKNLDNYAWTNPHRVTWT